MIINGMKCVKYKYVISCKDGFENIIMEKVIYDFKIVNWFV